MLTAPTKHPLPWRKVSAVGQPSRPWRLCPCLKCGMDPCGEAAHVRFSSGAFNKRGGMGKRPPDKWTLPLCPDCHTRDKDSQHRIGELQFWHDVGLSPLLVCEKLYAAKGDIVRMRAVVFAAIGERTRPAPGGDGKE